MFRVACLIALSSGLVGANPGLLVAAEPVAAESGANPAPLTWHTDYVQAMKLAREEGKLLFLFFHNAEGDKARQMFEAKSLADDKVMESLGSFVVAKVPVDAKIKEKGQEIKVLSHAAFEPMLARQGVAIVDLKNKGMPYHGCTVTAFPFDPGHYCTPEALRILVTLPDGTLTQRTMVFAVRIHPEAPASTDGDAHPVLVSEAEKHSTHQAAIRLQGHHQWEYRFHDISARMPDAGSSPTEVCAESWPGKTLVDAAIDCVHSWRQSPGHWNAVNARHGLFGYDMKLGANGIWYATGIFAKDDGRRRNRR
jgi:hypothetical protein